MSLLILFLKGHGWRFLNLSLTLILILANSADRDDMQRYAAYYMDLYSL